MVSEGENADTRRPIRNVLVDILDLDCGMGWTANPMVTTFLAFECNNCWRDYISIGQYLMGCSIERPLTDSLVGLRISPSYVKMWTNYCWMYSFKIQQNVSFCGSWIYIEVLSNMVHVLSCLSTHSKKNKVNEKENFRF